MRIATDAVEASIRGNTVEVCELNTSIAEEIALAVAVVEVTVVDVYRLPHIRM
jgi:hypothetical protein